MPNDSINTESRTPATIWLATQPAEPRADGWSSYAAAASATAELLWPLLFFICLFLLREQLRATVRALARRIKDPTTSVSFGSFELSSRVKELTSQVESLEANSGVLASKMAMERSTQLQGNELDLLRELAREYRNVEIPNWQQRIRRKDEIAAQMAGLVIGAKIQRQALAEDPDEGMRMALATTIHFDPAAGDDDHIKVAAPGVRLKHVRYRFMMAMDRLAHSGLVRPANARRFLEIAQEYRANADQPLHDRIDRTIAVLTPLVFKKTETVLGESP